jgi:hypothetical protein
MSGYRNSKQSYFNTFVTRISPETKSWRRHSKTILSTFAIYVIASKSDSAPFVSIQDTGPRAGPPFSVSRACDEGDRLETIKRSIVDLPYSAKQHGNTKCRKKGQ